MFQMSDIFIPKDPCDVFGRDIHYLQGGASSSRPKRPGLPKGKNSRTALIIYYDNYLINPIIVI